MKQKRLFPALFLFLILFSFPDLLAQPGQITTPDSFFGFRPCADRQLFTYEKLIEYLQELDKESGRLHLEQIGNSPMGKPMYAAFFSADENISNLPELQKINRKLALDPALTKQEKQNLIKEGKVFLLGTLSMHSSEVGPSQAAPLIAYQLVTTQNPDTLSWLKNVVYMMVPNHNPDGMDLVVNNYLKYKDTKYEGANLPRVYHKYVGHDNNRDFVTLTQKDTRAIAALITKEWFPQVMVEKHQMGYSGPRYFVPPPHDPIAENVDAGIWNWIEIFGSGMIKDMTGEGLKGVSQHYLFDNYWPGSTETCIWQNVIALLTECASAQVATPIYIEPSELSVGGKGLSEYKKSTNMPDPWPGGWWRLSDIAQYEMVSTMSLLKTASLYHDPILKFRNDQCIKEIVKGKTSAPYYYILPAKQHDPGELSDLVNLLDDQGIHVAELTKGLTIDNTNYSKGDIVISLAQPYRAFIKEVMEKQKYPVRHYTPGGEIIQPYDITSWSLPLHKGLKYAEIDDPVPQLDNLIRPVTIPYSLNAVLPATFHTLVLNPDENQIYKTVFQLLKQQIKVDRATSAVTLKDTLLPAGSFIIHVNDNQQQAVSKAFENISEVIVDPPVLDVQSKKELLLPAIALVETHFHDMDAGWTRFIFDQYGIPYTVIHPDEMKDPDFAGKIDVIVFPDENKAVLMEGKYKSGDDYYIPSYPPEYTKGMGKEGLQNILKFVNEGGKVVSWGGSTEIFIGPLAIEMDKGQKEEFQLPVNNIADNLKKEGLYVPGSLVRINLIRDNPVTWGTPKSIGVFYRADPVLTTSIPVFDMDRRVIASFPEENILMSGYAAKEEKLADKPALVWLSKGKGQLVLFSFSPQFRASTPVAYKLLFNSLLL